MKKLNLASVTPNFHINNFYISSFGIKKILTFF